MEREGGRGGKRERERVRERERERERESERAVFICLPKCFKCLSYFLFAGTPSRLNPVTTTTPSTPHLTPPSQTQPIQPQSLLTTTPSTTSGAGAPTTPAAAISLPTTAPVLGSLVQTLASLAGTNTTASPSPVPKAVPNSATLPPSLTSANLSPAQLQTTGVPPSSGGGTTGGLSAAAAASLLNTLILAQNVLTGGGASPAGVGVANPVSGGGVVLGDSGSVLSGIGLEAVTTGDHTTPQ